MKNFILWIKLIMLFSSGKGQDEEKVYFQTDLLTSKLASKVERELVKEILKDTGIEEFYTHTQKSQCHTVQSI